MSDVDGEVAIREHGSVTAVDSERLDGNVSIDLDQEPPLVGVPQNTAVVYEGEGADLEDDVDEPHVETDGGFVRERVRVRQYGLGLTGDLRDAAIATMASSYLGAGYLWYGGSEIVSVIAFVAGVLLTHLLVRHQGSSDA
ncbi:hypothetical protein VB779_09385 [Haloarculaceae archaeon H-GB11]|nr:hypothetical protein [Haloarculaceae archaeon H-GB11]